MITRPLDLQSRLNAQPRDLDVLFWFNVGAIALMFALFGSRFVLAKGVAVQVGSAEFELPQTTDPTAGRADVVVSYRRDDMVIFEGSIYELNALRTPLEAYAKKHPGSVMLARVDKQVSTQGLFRLCDLAHEVGFAQILIAAEAPKEEDANAIRSVR